MLGMGTPVGLYDYLELLRSDRRALVIRVPPELFNRKGSRHSAGRERALREVVCRQLAHRRRRAYRSEVALAITITGAPGPQAGRVVKSLLDALEGALYRDDRSVALLDVVAFGDPDSVDPVARIKAASAREYATRFDVVFSALAHRRYDADEDLDDDLLGDPFVFPEDDPLADEHESEWQETIRWARTNELIDEPTRRLWVEMSERSLRRSLTDRVLGLPFGARDRPGSQPVGLIDDDLPVRIERSGPSAIWIETPRIGEEGSWRRVAEAQIRSHAETWRVLERVNRRAVILDIAADGTAGAVFDLDNLARRVAKAFRAVHDRRFAVEGFRVYRRESPEPGVLVRLRSLSRAIELRRALGPMAPFALRPDSDRYSISRRNAVADFYARALPEGSLVGGGKLLGAARSWGRSEPASLTGACRITNRQ
jgi:hypothetical protein